MSTSVTLAPVATLAPIVWATKSGKAREAHTTAAQARAPAALRKAQADHATLIALQNGQYRPFLQDVRASLTKAQEEALTATVRAALTVTIDGQTMVPAGDVFASVNKALALAVASYVAAPTATVKGETVSKPLPKGKQYLSAIACQWLATMAPAGSDAGSDTAPAASESAGSDTAPAASESAGSDTAPAASESAGSDTAPAASEAN